VVAASVAPRGHSAATDREGKFTKRVANGLAIDVKTVETHRAAVMKKLTLWTTAQLGALCRPYQHLNPLRSFPLR